MMTPACQIDLNTPNKNAPEGMPKLEKQHFRYKVEKYDIFEQAFYRGREAIVNKDYTKRDEQATILKNLIADVLIQKAKDYITNAVNELFPLHLMSSNTYSDESTATLTGKAAHNLSEGYGFIYSLQFIKVSEKTYTRELVNEILNILIQGNGLWGLTYSSFNEILYMII